MRSAVLEDCVLCQETISSSEVAAKAREGQFEGQKIQSLVETSASLILSAADLLMAGDRPTLC